MLICNVTRQSPVRFRTSRMCEILRRWKICEETAAVCRWSFPMPFLLRYAGTHVGVQKHWHSVYSVSPDISIPVWRMYVRLSYADASSTLCLGISIFQSCSIIDPCVRNGTITLWKFRLGSKIVERRMCVNVDAVTAVNSSDNDQSFGDRAGAPVTSRYWICPETSGFGVEYKVLLNIKRS